MATKRLCPEDYTIGWLCALQCESLAARLMLDERHHPPPNLNPADENIYIYGEINDHNIVIVQIPTGDSSKSGATRTALFFNMGFPNMKIYLFVGIGGGMPQNIGWQSQDPIHLGDVIVSAPKTKNQPAIVEYDHGRYIQNQDFEVTSRLDKPIRQLIQAVDMLENNKRVGDSSFDQHLKRLSAEALKDREAKVDFETNKFEYPGPQYDILFRSDQVHVKSDLKENGEEDPTCPKCNKSGILRRARESNKPVSHRGSVASGDGVIQNGMMRDDLSEKQKVICFETEAAGVIDHNHCLVIRGVSDYADTHKNYKWHDYAAATAAAFAREVLQTLPPKDVARVKARPLSIQANPPQANPPQASGSGITQREEAGDGREVAAATTGDVEITDYSGPEGPPQYEPFKPLFKRDDQY